MTTRALASQESKFLSRRIRLGILLYLPGVFIVDLYARDFLTLPDGFAAFQLVAALALVFLGTGFATAELLDNHGHAMRSLEPGYVGLLLLVVFFSLLLNLGVSFFVDWLFRSTVGLGCWLVFWTTVCGIVMVVRER